MRKVDYREEFYRVSVRRHNPTGQILWEKWQAEILGSEGPYLGTHRVGAPAIIGRDLKTGTITSEVWFQNGHQHREDGPASIDRDPKTGVVVREAWWRNGELHRLDGPAWICRNATSGKVTYTQWYRDGQLIPYRERSKFLKSEHPTSEP